MHAICMRSYSEACVFLLEPLQRLPSVGFVVYKHAVHLLKINQEGQVNSHQLLPPSKVRSHKYIQKFLQLLSPGLHDASLLFYLGP